MTFSVQVLQILTVVANGDGDWVSRFGGFAPLHHIEIQSRFGTALRAAARISGEISIR